MSFVGRNLFKATKALNKNNVTALGGVRNLNVHEYVSLFYFEITQPIFIDPK